MPEIRQLSPSVINKIAAGEVIERPASIVKELLENAVDSGATRIELSVAQGGMELVRVADNGCGIAPEQLPLAVASHATSKIQDADDLFQVSTLGFRGEALASIAEVSRFLIRSRQAESNSGYQMEVNAGNVGPVEPCGCAVGTMVEVRDLFCNTPVRRKFVRSSQTEIGHCSEAFTRVALAYPQVHFVMRNNDKVMYDLPPSEVWSDRIATFFGADLGQSLILVEGEDSGICLSGYVADPNFNRANNRLQYLFLNGRCIRDRSLQHALSEAYRGLLLTGRFPIAFLKLDMPPDMVDVNVHPTKMEVRFQDSGRIYSQLLGTVRRKFLSTDLTPKVKPLAPADERMESAGVDAEQAQRQRRELLDWARGESSKPPETVLPSSTAPSPLSNIAARLITSSGIPAFKPFGPRVDTPHEDPFAEPTSAYGVTERRVAVAEASAPTPRKPSDIDSIVDLSGAPTLRAFAPAPSPSPVSLPMSRPQPQLPPTVPDHNRGAQFMNRYLVTEDEHGIVVIDQHALHERILYEQLREKVLSGKMETQRLLVPEPVSLTPNEAAAALEAKESLGKIGIEIEPFGGDTVLVTGYPAMLANLGPGEVLRQVVDRLMAGGKTPERRDLLDELLHMISCKAAVKAGDRLQPEEVESLLEQRHLFHDTHHCPHGRPTALIFTREELDKRFKRT